MPENTQLTRARALFQSPTRQRRRSTPAPTKCEEPQYRYAQQRFAVYCTDISEPKPTQDTATTFLAANPELTGAGKISWNRGLRNDLVKGTEIRFCSDSVRLGYYRPFNRQWAYLDRHVNDMIYQIPALFPTPHHKNIGIYQVGNGSAVPFSVLMTDGMPDLHVTGAGSGGQYFPRWTYKKSGSADGELDFTSVESTEVDEYGYQRFDNITDGILALYRDAVGAQVTKDDIFYYVYGLLHSPTYRQTYAADLKKMLPRIPTPESCERFEQFSNAGRRLADLHMRYEEVEPYPLEVQLKKGVSADDRETWRVLKMKWRNKNDHTAIVYNPKVTIRECLIWRVS